MEERQKMKVEIRCNGDVKDYERLITVRRIAEIINQAKKQGKWKK